MFTVRDAFVVYMHSLYMLMGRLQTCPPSKAVGGYYSPPLQRGWGYIFFISSSISFICASLFATLQLRSSKKKVGTCCTL